MHTNLNKVILVTFLSSVITSCIAQPKNQISPKSSLITVDKTLGTSNESAQNRPTNKTVTISVEGEKISIPVKLYQAKNLFSTYFPATDFLVQSEDAKNIKVVKFIANFGGDKNENAYIQFTFPNNLKTVEEVREFINRKNGLIASSQWQVISRSSTVTYPWAKEKIAFSKGEDIVGDIYIGSQNGKLFYVITHLPLEYRDGFTPREYLILNNLEISGERQSN
ncbi:hypothetical protein [Anabaena sp. UHCC 0451]|uniref:hypothetical protein n=1 Tax=Anabaena sp. UHCC 0451 TaxID=2055235 RepID=UPI002B21D169|nr:hypothetical protein [Anabaena sp. UHCC 0451]MEA5577824.1 hypothetical protein [Anabaena sp. UHCC 0451]